MKEMNKRLKVKRSFKQMEFTLTEILIVCAILGILASIFLGAYRLIMNRNLRVRTESIIKQIEIGLQEYKKKTGYYPPQPSAGHFTIKYDEDALSDPSKSDVTMISCFPNFQKWLSDGILDYQEEHPGWKERLLDGYGEPFWYRCPGYHNRSGFDIESAGPNKWFGYSKTSGHGISFSTQFTRDHDHSFGVNSKHSTIYYPEKQKDNIKNW